MTVELQIEATKMHAKERQPVRADIYLEQIKFLEEKVRFYQQLSEKLIKNSEEIEKLASESIKKAAKRRWYEFLPSLWKRK